MLSPYQATYLTEKLKEQYPYITPDQVDVVLTGFIQYVHLVNLSDDNQVPMYSESVDFVWHSFILHTREYDLFCQNQFGQFLHHVPSSSRGDWREDIGLREFFVYSSSVFGYDPFNGRDGYVELLNADLVLGIPNAINPSLLSVWIEEDRATVLARKGFPFFTVKAKNTYEQLLIKFEHFNDTPRIVNTPYTTQTTRTEYVETATPIDTLLMAAVIANSCSSFTEVIVEPAPVVVESPETQPSCSSCLSASSCGSSSSSCSSSSCSSSSCSSNSCSSNSCGGGF